MNMHSNAFDPAASAGKVDPRIVIVGAGMSDMLLGVVLHRRGFRNFVILEKAEKVGGTWRENAYPGLACDVPAYTYTYSFEPNAEWSHRFARGPEIQKYFERVHAKYGLEQYVRCNAKADSAKYENGQWTVTLEGGETLNADLVITAAGFLHHPSTPDIPGLGDFAGKTWHSARWDHSVDLTDKRVGIIGTGSTAVQIVGELAGKCAKLSQFQRTAQWVHPAYDTAYSEWSKKLLRRLPILPRLFSRMYAFALSLTISRLPVPDSYIHKILGWGCRRALKSVKDPVLRKKLTPDYQPGCKRLIFSDTYYKGIQRPDCELVTDQIERIESGGVRTRDGRLHELDVLVMATGFHAHSYMRPMRVTGEMGLELDDFWEPGAVAHRGVAIPGFPNFFMMLGPHSPIGNFSVIAISEAQADYILPFIEMYRDGKARRIEASLEATQKYNDAMRKIAKGTVWARGGCTSWYIDKTGLPAIWPDTFSVYKHALETAGRDEFIFSGPAQRTDN